jgi:hypothetical protein
MRDRLLIGSRLGSHSMAMGKSANIYNIFYKVETLIGFPKKAGH